MTFTLFRGGFAGSETERLAPFPASLAPNSRLAEVKKHLDRTSDAKH